MSNKDKAFTVALLMYANEPCRICGEMITAADVKTAVFAGYSKDDKARSAHKACWDKYPSRDGKTPRAEWKYQ